MRGVFPTPNASSGKPLRVVRYTSGSGTFTPLAVNSWVRVTVVAGGGGGANVSPAQATGANGGDAGCTAFAWLMLTGPVNYSVGAGGAPGSNPGNPSFFHTVKAWCSNPSTTIPNDIYHVIVGGVGGQGGGTQNSPGTNGRMPGCSQNLSTSLFAGQGAGGNCPGFGAGGGGGGDSLYGIGGAGGGGAINGSSAGFVGQNGTGYGAGGGGAGCNIWGGGTTVLGGSGSGGIIIIEEFGA